MHHKFDYAIKLWPVKQNAPRQYDPHSANKIINLFQSLFR